MLVVVWEGVRWAVDECFESTPYFLFFFQGWIEVMYEVVRWSVLEAGEVVVVRETQAVRGGQVEGVVVLQSNILVLLCFLVLYL